MIRDAKAGAGSNKIVYWSKLSDWRKRMFGFFAPCAKKFAVARPSTTRRSAARSSLDFIIVVCFWFVSFCRWENGGPIVLHAHDSPIFGDGFVPGFVEFANMTLAIVSPFAFGVG